ncbi:MAG: hypothetical protein QNK40_13620 [Desulfobacterales bacterium]|nr:hypothetical protein [Desulfobacterales bacterium]
MKKENHKTRLLTILLGTLIVLTFPLCSFSKSTEIIENKVVEIQTRPGVKQKFIFIKPATPIASVILFEGGRGLLKLKNLWGKPSVNTKMSTLLVNNREDLAKQGFMVALIDTPSDMDSRKLGRADFLKGTKRVYDMSPELAQDIEPVISFLKNEADIPVWLVGISRGTFSAVTTAIFTQKKINGLVLLSSETNIPEKWYIYKSHPKGILNMDLQKISVPALVIAHKDEKCKITPASAAPEIKEALINSPKTEVMYFTGGKKPKSGPCDPKSPHAFYGIEDKIITAIENFIKTNS